MQEALFTWMEHPKGVKPFPKTMEKLCLKYIPSLKELPQENMVEGRCSLAGLNRVITFYQNKEEERCIKTLGKKKLEEDSEGDTSPPPPSLKRKGRSTSSPPIKNAKVDSAIKDVSLNDPPQKNRSKIINKRVIKPTSPSKSKDLYDYSSSQRNKKPGLSPQQKETLSPLRDNIVIPRSLPNQNLRVIPPSLPLPRQSLISLQSAKSSLDCDLQNLPPSLFIQHVLLTFPFTIHLQPWSPSHA